MELTAKELFTVVATIQRLEDEVHARVAQEHKLVELLVAKNLLTPSDQHTLAHVLADQREVTRKTEIAQNEPEMPTAELPEELREELQSLGVVSQPKTLAETLTTDFQELVERVFQEFRREQREGGGEAGTVAEV